MFLGKSEQNQHSTALIIGKEVFTMWKKLMDSYRKKVDLQGNEWIRRLLIRVISIK